MSVKIFSDIIGNPNRDFPACSAVPHPTAPSCETEGHLTNSDVDNFTHIKSLILFSYLLAEESP